MNKRYYCKLSKCNCHNYKGAVAKKVHAKALREEKEREKEEQEDFEILNREAFKVIKEEMLEYEDIRIKYNPNLDYTNM